ncbi:class I SAM-dependent methyltransferase [Streptomyces sp. NPDC048338]|uniref:class I SAM-dependent methyltransferase n=1 Tax=Streptomyces sp. NPDC048338 TaxID=3365536 RepID=UPI003718F715
MSRHEHQTERSERCQEPGHVHGEGHEGHGGKHGAGHEGQAQGAGHAHGAVHGHHHDSAHMPWAEMATHLERQAEIQSPVYTAATAWLGELVPVAGVRRILDIGSGPGVLTALLAEAFPAAEVVAVDGTPELLERARARAEAHGLGDRVSTLHAELPDAIGELGEADLIWAGNSLHHIGDQGAALAAFAGLLRPGGLMVLVEGGLPARHLPWNIGMGRPGLEARMDAVIADSFGDMRASLRDSKDEVDDWRGLLAGAGLTPSGTRSFLVDAPAPVAPVVRDLVVDAFARLRDGQAERLAEDDVKVLDRLLDPADPESLHRRADLFHLAARTIHTAIKG